MYHGESDQEDFLVVSGECVLVIEGEERRLDPSAGPLSLVRRVRALNPHVGTWIEMNGGDRLVVVVALMAQHKEADQGGDQGDGQGAAALPPQPAGPNRQQRRTPW